ncbi:RNB domain-containing ribonuclease [Corynebacterium pyruviciproducens]|uniref:RNB domain-containing ribonuclease n=1 Tax=Corynebacterium pyruviciproducens TaxID=598660 RepID=UPI0003A7BB56
MAQHGHNGGQLYAADLNFDSVAEEFGINRGFPPELVAEAREARDVYAQDRVDAREISLVTVDPQGSKDLDQAVYIATRGEGFEVFYAIADVGAFVRPGSGLYAEALRCGQTVYLPDCPARLYPPELPEGSASLLSRSRSSRGAVACHRRLVGRCPLRRGAPGQFAA